MKVLYITNIPAPYRVDFFNELGNLCDLTVIYELDKAKDRDKNWKLDDSLNYKEHRLRGLQIRSDAAIALNIINILNKKKYDIIVLGGYSTPTAMLAICYMRFKKIPFILNCDGGFIKEDKKIIYKLKRFFIASASFWLSTGKKTDEYLIHYGANPNKIYKYPFSSIRNKEICKDIDKSGKCIYKKELGIKEDLVILSVGQFIPRKGFDILLESIKDLPSDIGIYIIGGNLSDLYMCKNELSNIKNVHFIPFCNKNLLSKYYKASNLFVLPTREDIWGLVINEAMAHGLPIITTDRCIAGLELIKGNGIIVKSNDSYELSKSIKNIIFDSNLMRKMSEGSIATIKEYTIENMAIAHYNIFKNCIRL